MRLDSSMNRARPTPGLTKGKNRSDSPLRFGFLFLFLAKDARSRPRQKSCLPVLDLCPFKRVSLLYPYPTGHLISQQSSNAKQALGLGLKQAGIASNVSVFGEPRFFFSTVSPLNLSYNQIW